MWVRVPPSVHFRTGSLFLIKVIGRLQEVSLPDFQLPSLTAKIDTGAYTSSLHCQIVSTDDKWVEFHVLDPSHPQFIDIPNRVPLVELKQVTSSNGTSELRPVIQTRIKIGTEEFDIFLTLTDRSEMRYPILLGRRFLSDKYLVDVNGINLLTD